MADRHPAEPTDSRTDSETDAGSKGCGPAPHEPVVFTGSGVREGAVAILPFAVGAILFGMLCGLMAATAGLSSVEAALMSATVFAGASQFFALDQMIDGASAAAIVLATFAINARHLLMGAAIAPWLRPLGRPGDVVCAFFMTDENWGLSMARMRSGGRDAGYYMGGGLVLFVLWISATVMGTLSGALIPDPAIYGLDFMAVAMFLALLAMFWRGRATLLPWLVAAVAAIAAGFVLPAGWPVFAGGLAGALAGAVLGPSGETEDRPDE